MTKDRHTPGPVETLARIAMQREDYGTDADLRDAVDAVLGNPIYDAAPAMLAALKKCKEACLFDDDDGSIGVTEDPHIPAELFNEICAALSLAEKGGEK